MHIIFLQLMYVYLKVPFLVLLGTIALEFAAKLEHQVEAAIIS